MEAIGLYTTPVFADRTSYGEVVHTWTFNEFRVNLLVNEDKTICYETIDSVAEKTIRVSPIKIPAESSLDKMITHLKNCRVIVEENGRVTMLPVCRTWAGLGKEVRLLRGQNNFIWEIFSLEKSNVLFSLFESTIPSELCHVETISLINKIKKDPFKEEHINYLKKDFKITQILEEEVVKKEISFMQEGEKLIKNRENDLITQGMQTFTLATFASVWLGNELHHPAVEKIKTKIRSYVSNYPIAYTIVSSVLVSTIIASVGKKMAEEYLKSDKAKGEEFLNLFEKRIKTLSSQKPLFMEIETKSKPSCIDPRVRVSKFTWGVTLVTHEGSLGNHAKIIVEGINDGYFHENSPLINKKIKPVEEGKKFICLAHFIPPVDAGLISQEDIVEKYETRTEIWMATREKVKEMLDNIFEEMDLPPEKRPRFNMFGKESVVHKIPLMSKFPVYGKALSKPGENCFTWAKNHLQTIGIELVKSKIGFIFTAAKMYTSPTEDFTEIPFPKI